MNQSDDLTAYPLSPQLTFRVINYLNFFRLFISLALALAYLTGGLVQSLATDKAELSVIVLSGYFILGVYLIARAGHEGINYFQLAQASLFADVLFIGAMLIIFGGLDSGMGVLLVFVSASAAILLPLRMALFLASLATITIIGEAFLGGSLHTGEPENLFNAGLYGITNLLTAILVHLLSFGVRDYRLIAESQRQTLTRLEQINELIIRRMRNGVLAVDHDGQIQLMNESGWFLLGSPPSADRVLAEVSPELQAAMDNWRQTPGSESEPLTLNASQAQVIPKFVALPGGHEIRTLVFLEDNDVVAQRAIELSSTSLAKLSGSIAHEIRNPLAAVSHAAQLLGESESLAEADTRLVTIIRNQSRRMNGIVENILQLSRREKSRPELFDLTRWLADLVHEFNNAPNTRSFGVHAELHDEEVLVMFDRSQLHQALWKLLENAVEHAGGDGRDPAVTLRIQRQEKTRYSLISVEDNGRGISKDQLGQIFEPFFTTRKQGSGLGLYIARQLCEANQAELTVDSTPGWKTRFHIRLALARGSGEEGFAPQDHSTEHDEPEATRPDH